MSGFRVDFVVFDRLRGRMRVVFILFPISHERIILLYVAIQV